MFQSSLPRIVLRTLRYFSSNFRWILVLLVIIGLSTLAGLLQVWPLALLVDTVLTSTSRSGVMSDMLLSYVDSPVGRIVVLAGMAVGLRVLSEILGMVQSMLRVRIGDDGLLRVRCHLFQKLQSCSQQFYRSQSQGDVILRLSDDTVAVQTVLNIVLEVIVACMTLAIMLAILATRSVLLTALSMLVAPLLIVANLWFAKRLGALGRKAKQFDSQFLSNVQRSMTNVLLMQAFGREQREYARFYQSAHGRNRAWQSLQWQWGWYRLVVGLIFGGGTACILGVGGWLVYRDQFLRPIPHGMSVGDLVVFLSYLAMFYDPLCKLSGAGASLQTALAGLERVYEVIDLQTDVVELPGAQELPPAPRTLHLQNLQFAYGDHPVLHNVTATIQPGQMVAFVGPSGAGKSTLLNLLPRFFDPKSGGIYLDQYDTKSLTLRSLRQHVALVLQEGLVLPTTIAENIAYGRPDATQVEIEQAARMAGASSFIERLPSGYDTEIAEGGQNLSGGQKQRIAIARALLTKAPILVLDEPTSALDAANERLVTETLERLRGDRTLIVVSHRLSTVRRADQIFVLSGGALVEQGTHDELMAQRGKYHQMAMQQHLPGSVPVSVSSSLPTSSSAA